MVAQRNVPVERANQGVFTTACCWSPPELAGLVQGCGCHGCVVATEGYCPDSSIGVTAVCLESLKTSKKQNL